MYHFLPITVFDGSYTPRFVVAVDVAGIQLFGCLLYTSPKC